MSRPLTKRTFFLLFLAVLLPALACAEGEALQGKPVAEMETVTVTGKAEDQLTGSNTLSRETLDHLPARNGSINEAIGILPGVQLPELGRSSTTAGEIIPPKVSISGGKTYQNNFLIDGFSNNSLLDPEFDDPTSLTLVPGHPQALFLNPALVNQINVYRYNVPARLGSFTGGVVEVQTIEPGLEFRGEASYRTTRHEWTQFHVDPLDKDTFENSNNQRYQPEFEKHDVGATFDIPLTDRLRLLAAYHLNYSRIPLTHIDDEEVLTRTNENYYAKLAYNFDHRTGLTASFNHAPYEGDYLYVNSMESDFTIEGGGDQATLEFKHSAEWGNMRLAGAWKSSENTRHAPNEFAVWATTPSKPWGSVVETTTPGYSTRGTNTTSRLTSSYEGSVGSLESSQSGFEVSGDVQPTAFFTGPLLHQLDAGFAFEQTTGQMKRSYPTYSYTFPVLVDSAFNCPPGIDACISGVPSISTGQFMSRRQYFAPDQVRATINLLDVYAEDLIKWDRLELRPGVRISYDDFMDNTNVSPRMAASYDLFGNGQTILIGGLNRYYGRTLLTYKLREASVPAQNFNRNRTTLAWTPTTRNIAFRYSELDTPYTDEAVVGVDQELFSGRLKVTGIKREGRDEFMQETVKETNSLSYYELTNQGETHHKEASLEWERSWEKHFFAINVTWQETDTNNEGYKAADITGTDGLVWYDGSYVPLDELPRRNFSRNWTGNLIYSAALPLGVTFTNVTRYRSGYEALIALTSSQKSALGLPPGVNAYHNEKLSDAWVFDWRFDWDLLRDQSLVVSLEINNVFDEDAELGNPANTSSSSSASYVQNYELGRQIWLGMTYKF